MQAGNHLKISLHKSVSVIEVRVTPGLVANFHFRTCRLLGRLSWEVILLPVFLPGQVAHTPESAFYAVSLHFIDDESRLVQHRQERSGREEENMSVLTAGGFAFDLVEIDQVQRVVKTVWDRKKEDTVGFDYTPALLQQRNRIQNMLKNIVHMNIIEKALGKSGL